MRNEGRRRRSSFIAHRLSFLGMSEARDQSEATLPAGKEPTLRVVPMPKDANFTGDIFGGWIMAQVDIAGSVPAMRAAKGRVATVAVNSFQFRQPVLVGDLVSIYAEVVRVGRTSITVNVEVYAQRRPDEVECVKVTEATLTYVAVDDQRKSRVVSVQQ
jgi:acyl-CoA thioesterase YciA